MDERRFSLTALGVKPDVVADRKVQQHGGNLVPGHCSRQRQIGAEHGPPVGG